MKKSLALILALMMVLSMFTMGITVSAADDEKPAGAKAISTVAELKNMAADTYYYLTADIYLGSPSEHAEMTEPSTEGEAEVLVDPKEEALITIPAGATLDGNGFTIYQNCYRKNPGWFADNNKYTMSAVWTHEMFALSAGNQITLKNLKFGSKTLPVYFSRSNALDADGKVVSGYTVNDGFGIFKDAEGTNVVWNNVNVYGERYGRNLDSYNFGYYMFKTYGTHKFEQCTLNSSILSAGSQYGGWIYSTATTGSLTFNNCVNAGFDTITGYKDDEAGNRTYVYEGGKIWGSVGGGFIHTASCNVTMTNCTNNLDMSCTYSGTGYKFGAFVGEQAAGDILVQACVNNGNFTLDNITIGGGIVGRGQSGVNASYRIINCINNGDIKRSGKDGTTSNHGFGGITGHTGSTTTYEVIGCVNNGDIQGTGNIGGIVGLVEGTAALKVIQDCSNYGNITSVKCVEAGGIVGQPRGDVNITNCKNFGNIATAAYNGGIIGQGWTGNTTINLTNCVNYGQIGTTAYKYAGGMLGRTTSALTFNFTNCINYGKMLTCQYSGGMIAEISSGATINMNGCKNYGEIAGVHAVAGFVGQTGAAATINMTACLNAGSIHQSSAAGEGIGGFLGRIGNAKAAINLESCVNTGTITGSNKNSAAYGAFGDTFGQFIGAYTVNHVLNYAGNELVGGFVDWTADGVKKPVLFDCYAFGNAVPHKDAKSLTGWVIGYKNAETGKIEIYAQTKIPAASSVPVTAAPNNGFYGINVEIDEEASWIDTIDDIGSVEEAIAAIEEILGMDFVAGNGDEAPVAVATPMLRGYQMATDGTALRVLATVNSTSYANIGFKVTVANKGNTLINNEYRNVEKVWTAIKAAGADGTVNKVTAAELGATYITAVTFTNLPATGTFTFTVTPTATDADGATVYTGATYVITVAHGAVTSVVQQ